ncbi:MAG: FtsX-like permease family protein, partial [Bryobacteraceae bacterium]
VNAVCPGYTDTDLVQGGIEHVIAKTGRTREQALAELAVVQNRIAASIPDRLELKAQIVPIGDQIAGRHKQGLWLLLAAVGFVLLIGCVNVANLLLVRSTVRARELAVRASLGARRGRLFRQQLAESLLLAGAGGTLGIGLAAISLRAFLAFVPIDLPRMETVQLDGRVLAFAGILTALVSILAGLLPAWRISRLDPQHALRGGGRTATDASSTGRWRNLLVGVEVALSAVCLFIAGLLLQSFTRILGVAPGFSADNVLTAKIALMGPAYEDTERRTALLREALQKTAALPHVLASGVANLMPLAAEGNDNLLLPEGSNTPISEQALAEQRFVNPHYFRALGIPLLSGRVFSESDKDRALAVISQRTAHRLWPGQNPLGKRVHIMAPSRSLWEVVGVVGEVSDGALDKTPNYAIYVPFWLRNRNSMVLAVRTSGDPRAVAADVRRVLRDLDPELPLSAFETLASRTQATVAPRRFQLALVLAFAIAALLLASLGIYGVVAYSASLRRAELGVRLALGATPGAVRSLVVRQGLTPVIWGLVTGAAGGVLGGRLIRALLFGVQPGDAATIAVVAAVLLTAAAAACWVPATRAARLDPLAALRCD